MAGGAVNLVTVLLWTACALAAVPTVLIVLNLRAYRPPPENSAPFTGLVSVLIPARDEEANIRASLDALDAVRDTSVEIVVLDDDSRDGTAAVVAERARADARIRLLRGRPLPHDGCGKPFACLQLAEAARGAILLFVDADVRLAPDAVRRIAAELAASDAALLSGVPMQITPTWRERLLVPLIMFVLLGYLSITAMRRSSWAAFGAACGQLVAVRRDAYFAVGGHREVLARFHDGVALARLFRARGFKTELADFAPLAECRMYDRFGDLVAGFAKNAHEGLGSLGGIVPWTILLIGGHVLPVVGVAVGLMHRPEWLLPAVLALVASYAGRFLLAHRFERGTGGAALHPIGVAALVAIQWYALARRMLGMPVSWKGRFPVQRA